MSGTSGYQASLPIAGRPVLVVGAGAAALGRIAALRGARAEVTVIAREALPAIADMADRGLLTWDQREWNDADLKQFWLVFAATGDPGTDEAVFAACESAMVFALPGGTTSVAVEPAEGRRRLGGKVVLVGGGPGDPGLLTVSGLLALREADVIVSDRLAPLAALVEAKKGAELIDVSKIPRGQFTAQEEINRLLIAHAGAGKTVVRFKGGDNFVFGRGGEEWQACAAAGIAVELIPGVTSAIAAPALAGIPVTHRGLNQGFTVISGHVPPGDERSTLDYSALARTGTDLVLMMAVATLPAIAEALVAGGMDPQTPAATIADGGLPTQRVIRGTVASIGELTVAAGIGAPAVTVIGAVAGFDPEAP